MLSHKKHRPSRKRFDSEILMKQIHKCLTHDLKSYLPVPYNFDKNHDKYPIYCHWDTYRYKIIRQLEDFGKRIIFKDDSTYDELHNKTVIDFLLSQDTYGIQRVSPATIMVLNEARSICHSVLSDFDFDVFFELCGPGKKAALGLPYSESYLDNRFGRMTGTLQQIRLLQACYAKDKRLHRLLGPAIKRAQIVDHVKMTSVPKSFKINRLIAPDTLAGGFLSRGLGNYIRLKLEANTHLRLSEQQHVHRNLARESSITGKLATIDLSKASDSISHDLLNWLLPPTWMHLVEIMRAPSLLIDGVRYNYTTQMLMGSGHTFPLQTLIFYSLCKAVCQLLHSKAKVNVYGDDIIVPTWAYYYIVLIFSNIGLTVNNEKSFVEGAFRESCGGDYHCGVDVRPFMPEHVTCFLVRNEYVALLHKIHNGFIERWTHYEIPSVFTLIESELMRINGKIVLVPTWEPPDSGLYTHSGNLLHNINKPVYDKQTQMLSYYKLRRRCKRRRPSFEGPYMWYWLYATKHSYKSAYDDVGSSILDKGLEPKKGMADYGWVSSLTTSPLTN